MLSHTRFIIPGLLAGLVLTSCVVAAPPSLMGGIKLGKPSVRTAASFPGQGSNSQNGNSPIQGPTLRPTKDRPVLRIPDGIIVGRPKTNPTKPLVEAGPLTVAPAILQVLREDNKWATARNVNGLPIVKFLWHYSDPKTASARWELFQPISQNVPGGNGGGHHYPPGPQAVLIAWGNLSPMPAPNAKQEFTINLAQHIVGLSPPNGAEYRVRVVFFDGAGKQFATSNEDQLHRLAPSLKVLSYDRIYGKLDVESPSEDAFIRANVQNTGANYEGGGHYEFYAKTGNNAPILIGKGQLLPVAAGQTLQLVAMRPVGDWNKSAAQSVFTYECKLMP